MNDLAWAAGFFEGEGSVRISKPALRNWGSLCVDIPNTDESLVRFFGQWGGSVHFHPQQGRRRAYWRWRVSSRQAAAFLAEIRPYVRSERVLAKIDHGLAFQAQKQSNRSDEAYREDQWAAYWWMAELNARGVKGS